MIKPQHFLLLIAFVLCACSKDDSAQEIANDQEQSDSSGDSDDSSDSDPTTQGLRITTKSNYHASSETSYAFFTIPETNTVGAYVELQNNTVSTVEIPENPENKEMIFHMIYVSKDSFGKDRVFVYNYTDFDATQITLERNPRLINDCLPSSNSATLTFASLPVHERYTYSRNGCDLISQDTGFSETVMTIDVNDANASFYLTVSDINDSYYVAYQDIEAGESITINEDDFSDEMRRKNVTVAENTFFLRSIGVTQEALHFGSMTFAEAVKSSAPIASPYSFDLPEIASNLFKTEAVFENRNENGAFVQSNYAYDFTTVSQPIILDEIASTLSFDNTADIPNLSYTATTNAVKAIGLTAYNLQVENGTTFTTDFIVFLTLSERTAGQLDFPTIPSELVARHPSLNEAALSNKDRQFLGVEHIEYTASTGISDYYDHFFSTDGIKTENNWLSGFKSKFEARTYTRSLVGETPFLQGQHQLPPTLAY